MKFKISGALMVAAMSMTITAFAQQSVRISQDGRPERLFRPVSGLNMRDMQFVKDAAAANNFEILTSKLAIERSGNTFVQEFAKEMVHEHQSSQNELRLIAMRKGVSLPSRLPANLQSAYNRLARLNGAAFDRAYQMWQKQGHEGASLKFKAEIRNGRDQDIKAYAVKTLPAVTMHYKMLLAKRTMMGATKMDHGM
jgi:putative membrane protein